MIKPLNKGLCWVFQGWLSSKEIESKIKRLISHFTITLIYEFNSEIALRRARKFTTEETSIPFCFDNLEDMLYVPESKKSIIPLGRFNKKEEEDKMLVKK